MKWIYLIFLIFFNHLIKSQATYYHDIVPILDKHCVNCHQNGDIGPMSLTTYDEVASYANMIKFVTDTKLMPPFKANTIKSKYKNERSLSDQEKAIISDWIENGLLQGNSPHIDYCEVDSLKSTFDTTLCMSQSFEHYGIYYDQYQVFVIPTDLREGKYINDIKFTPGNKEIVRSAQLSVAPLGASETIDKWDPRYGYFAYGSLGFTPSHPNWFSWMPYTEALELNNHQLYLPNNSEILMHIHYGPYGEILKDSSCVSLSYETESIGRRVLQNVALVHPSFLEEPFLLEPGFKKRITTSFILPQDITLRSITPLAHLLCRSWEVYGVLPDKSTSPILSIEDWDFHWKEKYVFENPIILPKGTKIYAHATYDNTSQNPYNPASPPHPMKVGPHMYDENFICYFELESTSSTSYIIKSFSSTDSSIDQVQFYISHEGNYTVSINDISTNEHLIIKNKIFPMGHHTLKSSHLPSKTGRYVITLSQNQEILDYWWVVVY